MKSLPKRATEPIYRSAAPLLSGLGATAVIALVPWMLLSGVSLWSLLLTPLAVTVLIAQAMRLPTAIDFDRSDNKLVVRRLAGALEIDVSSVTEVRGGRVGAFAHLVYADRSLPIVVGLRRRATLRPFEQIGISVQ